MPRNAPPLDTTKIGRALGDGRGGDRVADRGLPAAAETRATARPRGVSRRKEGRSLPFSRWFGLVGGAGRRQDRAKGLSSVYAGVGAARGACAMARGARRTPVWWFPFVCAGGGAGRARTLCSSAPCFPRVGPCAFRKRRKRPQVLWKDAASSRERERERRSGGASGFREEGFLESRRRSVGFLAALFESPSEGVSRLPVTCFEERRRRRLRPARRRRSAPRLAAAGSGDRATRSRSTPRRPSRRRRPRASVQRFENSDLNFESVLGTGVGRATIDRV